MTRAIPVSIERHGSRFWRRFEGYEFARNTTLAPLVLAEILPAASAFPILLCETDGHLLPHALLGTDPTQGCAFVNANTQWRGHYVPATLRSHPFSAAPTSGADGFELRVQEGSGLVTDDIRDERFFDTGGAPSAALQEVVQFLRRYEASRLRTIAAATLLRDIDVLRPFRSDGIDNSLTHNSWQVDGQALERLAPQDLHRLMQAGAIQLAHAQQVSLGLLKLLTRAADAHSTTSTQAWDHGHTREADMAGSFLSALAQAQESDKEALFLTERGF